jgi:N-alpha-acetyltransferase 10/11
MNVYYLAEVRSVVARSRALPVGFTFRPVAEDDVTMLAGTFERAYGPAVASSVDAAVAEMRSSFGGTWGVLWPEASPVAWNGDEVAGAVLAVRRPASMDGAPGCPWLIDVFTDPRYQRAGIALGLMGAACRVMLAAAEPRVGLTVDTTNSAAVSLYQSLGFAAMT